MASSTFRPTNVGHQPRHLGGAAAVSRIPRRRTRCRGRGRLTPRIHDGAGAVPHAADCFCTPYARRVEIDWAPLIASTGRRASEGPLAFKFQQLGDHPSHDSNRILFRTKDRTVLGVARSGRCGYRRRSRACHLGLGFELGYAWLLGSEQHLSMSIGVGATRVLNGEPIPVLRLVNVGWAF